jgi:hypothetical protein
MGHEITSSHITLIPFDSLHGGDAIREPIIIGMHKYDV